MNIAEYINDKTLLEFFLDPFQNKRPEGHITHLCNGFYFYGPNNWSGDHSL